MSRKWFMILLVAAILGLVFAVSTKLTPLGIIPFGGGNNQPSSTSTPTLESEKEAKSNSVPTGQIKATELIPTETTLAQNHTTANQGPQTFSVQRPVNFSIFESSDSGISIQYPSNWQVDDEDNDRDGTNDIAGFLSPFEDRFDTYKERVWLSLDTLPGTNVTLDEYARGVIENNNNSMQNFRLLDSDTDSMILAGYPAYRFVTTWTLEDGTILKQMEIGTKIGDKVYYIDYYAEHDKYAGLLPVVQEMINSFKTR